MKKYIDYMNEITPDMLFEGLLGHGLFSDKLPPIFTSEKFMEFCQKNNICDRESGHRWIAVEILRNTNVPRIFGIPNPLPYYHLCKFLQDNWDKVKAHFKENNEGNNRRISRIHLQKIGNSKKIFEMNYQNRHYDDIPEDELGIGSKYIVRTDISSCFPSIYTHAIPWAIMGKCEAKKYVFQKHKNSEEQNKGNKGWSNDLDRYARGIQNYETHGIIIGPHTSNLLSEIILTTVDKELKEYKFVRYIDDYVCYVASYEEGERFITSLAKNLKNYGLSINHKKTRIEKLPAGEMEPWINKMNRARLSWLPSIDYREGNELNAKKMIGYNEAKQYLIYAIETGLVDAAAINYAVKVLCKNYIMSDTAKNYVYKKMLYLAEIYPYLLRLLDEYVFDLSSEKEYKEQLSNRIFKDAMATHKYEEAYYAMLFAIKYDFLIEMKDSDYDKIIDSNDCLLLLISWLYFNKYNNEAMKQKLKDKAKALSEDEFDEYWLFAYECLSENELPEKPDDKKLAKRSYADEWKTLKRCRVSFIKDEWRKLCII